MERHVIEQSDQYSLSKAIHRPQRLRLEQRPERPVLSEVSQFSPEAQAKLLSNADMTHTQARLLVGHYLYSSFPSFIRA